MIDLNALEIYIAGPLFTEAERQFNAKLAELVRRRKHNVFLPQELPIDFDSPTWKRDTFMTNVRHIDKSEIIIAVLDGPICDDGTSWEFGYAWANYKHIIGLRTDFRTAGPEGIVNLMLGESADVLCKSYQEVMDALYAYEQKKKKEFHLICSAMPKIHGPCDFGRSREFDREIYVEVFNPRV